MMHVASNAYSPPRVGVVTDLPIPELVENQARSVAMLPPGTPALNRDEALKLLRQLKDALDEVRWLRAGCPT